MFEFLIWKGINLIVLLVPDMRSKLEKLQGQKVVTVISQTFYFSFCLICSDTFIFKGTVYEILNLLYLLSPAKHLQRYTLNPASKHHVKNMNSSIFCFWKLKYYDKCLLKYYLWIYSTDEQEMTNNFLIIKFCSTPCHYSLNNVKSPKRAYHF